MSVTIIKSKQSSGRTPAGQDFLSGLMTYGTAPTVAGKWNSYQSSIYPTIVIKAQQLFSPEDATNAGIVPFSDNVAQTATYKITTLGLTGDTLLLTCVVPIVGRATKTVTICNYTVGAADNTEILQAAAIVALVNGNTYSTGWSATTDGVDTVTLIAPKSCGIFLNTGTPYVATLGAGATLAGTLTQKVISGTASNYSVWKYHIDEFFRLFPSGNIWIGIIDASDYDFKELLSLQSASGNSLRLIGVYCNDENVINNHFANMQKIQTRAMELDGVFPFEVLYTGDYKGATLSNMKNGQTVKYNKVSSVISQDGMAKGDLLYRVNGFSVGNIGAKLATLAKSRVSSSDAQAIDDFNLSDGTENDTPAFCNGDLLSATDANLISQLKNYRHIFFQVFTGNVVGTYWNGNFTFCDQTYRYAFMNDNRIASKITRICNKTYIPLMEGEVYYNPDGTLTDASVELFQDAGIDAITAECITGQGSTPLISGAPIVTVDPNQDLQATGNLNVVVKIGENGIARDITVYQGFTN